MDGRRRGVFIGVNQCSGDARIPTLRFAEDDAIAMMDVLTDELTGTVDPADVSLLVGQQATATDVKRALRAAALATEPDDVLFVYFAGHGMLPAQHSGGDPFLLTSDITLDALRLEPDRGLRMGYLRHDVFDVARGQSFLVLDCCQCDGLRSAAAATQPSASDALQHALGEIHLRQLNRYSALLACPKDAATREPEDLQHGFFTHYLLRGLRGDAAGTDGNVSFEQLGGFIAGQGLHPPPGFFVPTWGRTTNLTRPGAGSTVAHPSARTQADAARPIIIVPSPCPLDGCAGPLTRFLKRAFWQDRWPLTAESEVGHRGRVELVRFAVDAEALALVSFGSDSYQIEAATAEFAADRTTGILEEIAARARVTTHGSLGYVCLEDSAPQVLAVPLAQEPSGRFTCLVVVNADSRLLAMGEPLTTVLRELWRMPPREDALVAELKILTAIRSVYGRFPPGLYHYALQVYSQLLNSMVMVFEPVMSLGPRAASIGISSWEALARRSESEQRAPVDLLETAPHWGDEFIIERDRILGAKAIYSYAWAHSTSVFANDAPAPISINVGVRSLISDAYAEAIRSAIRETGLDHRKVTLEISERDPIEPRANEVWSPSPIVYFQERLASLSQTLGVSFAVDDFGVGHASLHHLASLTLAHIKVDRAILYHPLALDEISLVVSIARDATRRLRVPGERSVVVEGFDEASPVPLRDIYGRGVRYVQGYITEEPASTTLRPLSQDLRARIAAQLADIA